MIKVYIYNNIIVIKADDYLTEIIEQMFSIHRIDRTRRFDSRGNEYIKTERVFVGNMFLKAKPDLLVLHKDALDDIIIKLKENGYEYQLLRVNHKQSSILTQGTYQMDNSFELRDHQHVFINDMNKVKDGGRCLVSAKTGVGKTSMSQYIGSNFDGNSLFVMSAKYLTQWKKSYHKMTELKEEDIILIQGSSKLKEYIDSCYNSIDNQKRVVLLSSETLSSHIRGSYLDNGYLKPSVITDRYHPANLMLTLGCKTLTIDEIHQKPIATTLIMLSLNPYRIIGLSATLYSSNPKLNRILQRYVFPTEHVSKHGDDESYINLVTFGYDINVNYTESLRGFDSKDYMTHIMRSRYKESYFEWTRQIVDVYYLDKRVGNSKCLIFFPTIVSIVEFQKYLERFSNNKDNYNKQLKHYVEVNKETFLKRMVRSEIKKIVDIKLFNKLAKYLMTSVKKGYKTIEHIENGHFDISFVSKTLSKYLIGYFVDNLDGRKINIINITTLLKDGMEEYVLKRNKRFLDSLTDERLVVVMSKFIDSFEYMYIGNYKGLISKQFHGVHNLEDILDSDIILTTEGKASAGVDVPNLQVAISSVNKSSKNDAIQMIGRIRKNTEYEQTYIQLYNTCEPKTVKQVNNLFDYTKDKLKTYTDVRFDISKEQLNDLYPLDNIVSLKQQKLVKFKWVNYNNMKDVNKFM